MGQKLIKVLLIALFVGLISPQSVFAKKKKLVIKIGSVAPGGTPWAKLAENLKKEIAKGAKKTVTDRKSKVKLYLGGILGGEKSVLRRVKKGEIDLFGGSLGVVATDVPELGVIELPYLFPSYKHADEVLDNIVKKDFIKLLRKKGYVFMLWSENGYRNVATKEKAIISPGDIKGLKIRAQEQAIYTNTYKSWGASPVPIAVPEVLSALQTGVVDGFDQTLLFTFATSWYTAIKHYSLTGHIYQPGICLLSEKKYNKYPKPFQHWIMNNDPLWEKYRKSSTKQVRKISKILITNLKKANVNVYKLSNKEKKLFAAKVQPVYDKYNKTSTKDGKRILAKILKYLKSKGK